MIRFSIILMLYGAVTLLELPRLLRERAYRETVAFAVLCSAGLLLAIPWALGRPLRFPSEAIMDFLEPLANLLLGPP